MKKILFMFVVLICSMSIMAQIQVDFKNLPNTSKTTTISPKINSYDPIYTHPNYVIGEALKNTGTISIAAGIPCLFAGTILLAVGSHVPEVDFGDGYLSDKKKLDKLEAASKDAEAKGKMQLAGCILLPIGASLTIIGIPLYVHGKRIMDLNFNYTGNGVGVSMEF